MEKESKKQQPAMPTLFRSVSDTGGSPVTWENVYAILRGELLREDTAKYRAFREQRLDADARGIKKRMMVITPAVQCTGGRRAEHIRGYTFVSMCDFDHVRDPDEALRRIRADRHAMMVYRTISGNGIRVFFRYETEQDPMTPECYRTAFRYGNLYFGRIIGEDYDKACAPPNHPASLCHDPEATFQPGAEPFRITGQVARSLTDAGTPRQWLRRSSGTRTPVGEAAPLILDRLTQEGHVYCEHHHNDFIMRCGYLLNQLGVDRQEATAWATGHFHDYPRREVEGIIRSCYRKTAEHGTLQVVSRRGGRDATEGCEVPGRKGGTTGTATIAQLKEYIRGRVRLRRNVISDETEIAPVDGDGFRPLTDHDVNSLWAGFCETVGAFRNVDIHLLINSDFVPDFNPFDDYIARLPRWDPDTCPDYLAQLAATVHLKAVPGSDEDMQLLFREYLTKWMVGMVAPLLGSHSVNHVILALVGSQGIYKTTWLQHLLPPELRRYYYAKTNSSRMTKDDLFTTTEFLLVNCEEIDTMRPAELNQLKAVVTATEINERPAYGRNKAHRRHICSFCATGNNILFLNDPTGNRRWLPFEVESIDDPHGNPFPYEGIYSQLVWLYRNGFRYWFSKEEIMRLNTHNERFEQPDMERELILRYYALPREGQSTRYVTASDVTAHLTTRLHVTLSVRRVSINMHRLMFPTARIQNMRCYLVHELSEQELSGQQQSIFR